MMRRVPATLPTSTATTQRRWFLPKPSAALTAPQPSKTGQLFGATKGGGAALRPKPQAPPSATKTAATSASAGAADATTFAAPQAGSGWLGVMWQTLVNGDKAGAVARFRGAVAGRPASGAGAKGRTTDVEELARAAAPAAPALSKHQLLNQQRKAERERALEEHQAALAEASGAEAPVRRKKTSHTAVPPPRSDAKAQSPGRRLLGALAADRRTQSLDQPFDLWKTLKAFPWKSCIVFMVCWSAAGTYFVPWFKGWKDGTPPTREEARAVRLEQLIGHMRRREHDARMDDIRARMRSRGALQPRAEGEE